MCGTINRRVEYYCLRNEWMVGVIARIDVVTGHDGGSRRTNNISGTFGRSFSVRRGRRRRLRILLYACRVGARALTVIEILQREQPGVKRTKLTIKIPRALFRQVSKNKQLFQPRINRDRTRGTFSNRHSSVSRCHKYPTITLLLELYSSPEYIMYRLL